MNVVYYEHTIINVIEKIRTFKLSRKEENKTMQEMKWLSMKEVCDYLHISRDTVMNWINKEGMPAHKKGRLWRFDINEVDEWMKTNESKENE